ncbi:unnamed protein product [Phytophthora lilii]|uniref:Unnamed protein product n=1 Tax=Phytophthora lilii TaxID=2077276 RepID=A0A9W6WPB6_9STRA|nr:unnamed protein product [Phytophthora lilii]
MRLSVLLLAVMSFAHSKQNKPMRPTARRSSDRSKRLTREEEERANMGFFNNLFKGSAAKKAAAAAKKQKAFQDYSKMLERDDALYLAMARWVDDGTAPIEILNKMKAAGIADDKANEVFLRFLNYRSETACKRNPL